MCNIIEILELNVQYYKNMGHIKLFVMHTFVKLELKSITYFWMQRNIISNLTSSAIFRKIDRLLAQSKLLCHKKVKQPKSIQKHTSLSLGEDLKMKFVAFHDMANSIFWFTWARHVQFGKGQALC